MVQRTVCIVTPDLAGPTRNGGIGTHCLQLARFLARRGDAVTIVHTGPPDDADHAVWKRTFREEHGATLLYLDELPDGPMPPILPATPRHATAHRIDRWLRTQAFHEVHFQDWQGNGAIAVRARHTGAAHLGTRLVVTAHGSSEWIREGMHAFPVEGRESLIDDALERTSVELADTLVCPSRYMHGWLQAHGWRLPADARVVPYLFELPDTVLPARGIAAGALDEIVFYGRLETRKGLEPFLAALERIAATPSPSHGRPRRVHFVGKAHTAITGPALEAIERVRARCGHRFEIEMHTSLDQQRALAFLQARPDSLVVMPSLADNLPFAVIECLALGHPLLTSDRGGIPEIVDSPAHLVEPTASALAQRIGRIAIEGLPALAHTYDVTAAEAGWSALTGETPPARVPLAAPLRVSVCVPHFNQTRELAGVLAALEAQTAPPFEVIVVDDGSDNAHRAVWDDLQRRYAPRGWRFLRQPNAGPSAARNTAAAAASGEALLFCDADNRPHPDMVERMAIAMQASGSPIVTCGFAAHGVGSDGAWTPEPDYFYCPVGDAIELALLENFIGDVNFLIRRGTFVAIGGFDPDNTDASEDWELLLQAVAGGVRVAVLPDPIFDYRIAPASHARSHTPRAGAEAVWKTIAASERERYLRLLRTVRGTFTERTRLAQLPIVEGALANARTHAAQLEEALALSRGQFQQTLEHAANLEQLLETTRTALAQQNRHIENLKRSIEATQLALAQRQQHVENLERRLDVTETALDRREQDIRDLERLIERTRLDLANKDCQVRDLQSARQELEARSARAEKRAEAIAQDFRILAGDFSALQKRSQTTEASQQEQIALLGTQLAIREDKIRRMAMSFSWRATAPLRSLRRAFVDRFRFSPIGPSAFHPEPLQEEPPIETRSSGSPFRFVVDQPTKWNDLSVRRTKIRGWMLRNDRHVVTDVRIRCGDNVFVGECGLVRIDIQAAFPDHPFARTAGFEVPVRLSGFQGEVVVEAKSPLHDWETVTSVSYTMARNATEFPPTPYDAWRRTHEDFRAETLQALRDEVAYWDDAPRISILVPVHNTPARWLRRAIASVREQTYPHWELCLADDASTEPHIRRILEELAGAEPRIKVAWREVNGHISAASNSALALATGDWIALLDHDDELAPNALHEVAALLRARPDTDLIYSDEDKIDADHQRSLPYFKPEFLPDLITAQNFISHLAVYRASIVRDLGGFREGYEGSQDWDLTLRLIERTDATRIHHIPKILYHWRAIPGSTALLLGEKDYTVDAARRALADHFARRGEAVELLPVAGGHWRVRHPLPDPVPSVTLVILTRNRLELLQPCVESIRARTSHPDYDILIVDNGSDDPATLAWLQEIAEQTASAPNGIVRVVRDEGPFNYAALNNAAVARARGEFVGLLNNDLEVIEADWLEEMVAQASRPDIGCVGAMLYYPNGTIQHAGVVLGVGGVAGHAFKALPRGTDGYFNRARLVQNYSAVTAACLVVRKTTYLEVGGLDAQELAVAFNDIDFCLKVQATGRRNLWTPFAELFHHESASRGAEDSPEKAARFRREIEVMQRRWGEFLLHDPAYSPNLSLEHEDFSIRATHP